MTATYLFAYLLVMPNATNPGIECPIHDGLPNGTDEYDDPCDHCKGTGYRLCINHDDASFDDCCNGFAIRFDGEWICGPCARRIGAWEAVDRIVSTSLGYLFDMDAELCTSLAASRGFAALRAA